MATLADFGQTTKPDTRGNIVTAVPIQQNYTYNSQSQFQQPTVSSIQSLPTSSSISTALDKAGAYQGDGSNYNPYTGAVQGTGSDNNVGPLPGQSWEGGPGSTQYIIPQNAPSYVGQQALAGQVRNADAALKSALDKQAKGFYIDPASASYMKQEEKDRLRAQFDAQAKADVEAATKLVNDLQIEQNRQAAASLQATPVPGAPIQDGAQGTTKSTSPVPSPISQKPLPGGTPSWIGSNTSGALKNGQQTTPTQQGTQGTNQPTPTGGTPSTGQQNTTGGTTGVSQTSGGSQAGTGGTNQPPPPPLPTPQQTADYIAAQTGASGYPPQIQQGLNAIIDAAHKASIVNGTTLENELANIELNKANTALISQRGQALAATSATTQIQIEKEIASQEKNLAAETQRSKLASVQDVQAMNRANYAYQEQQQRQTNIQTEIQDRAYLLSTGQSMNSAGLEWQNRQIQRGTEAMNYIFTQAANSETKYGDDRIGIINEYANSMNQIDQKQLADTQNIFATYNKTINDLRNTEIADTAKQNELEQKAYKDYNDALVANDFKVGDAHMKASDTMLRQENIIAMRQMQNDWRKFSAEQRQTTHNDQMDNNDRAFSATQAKNLKSGLMAPNAPVKTYVESKVFSGSFDTASAQYDSAQNDSQRATAAAQMAIQFSHIQNPGSLRLQDLAGNKAEQYQSLWDSFRGKLDQYANGGLPVPPEFISAMEDIVAGTMESRQKNAEDSVVSAALTAKNLNENYIHNPQYQIKMSQLTDDPILLKAAFGAVNDGYSDYEENSDNTSEPMSYIKNNGFRITQDFNGTYDKEKGYTTGNHNAYDLAPPVKGQTPPIPAISGGTVTEIGTTGPYGNHIYITDQNGIKWLYGHLSSLNVKKGDSITRGQQVGIMGDTGQSDGVHLHLEAYKDGKPFDFIKNNIAFQGGGADMNPEEITSVTPDYSNDYAMIPPPINYDE